MTLLSLVVLAIIVVAILVWLVGLDARVGDLETPGGGAKRAALLRRLEEAERKLDAHAETLAETLERLPQRGSNGRFAAKN